MTWTEEIRFALSLPNGARFFKCALQVNPHHYSESYRGEAAALSEEEYITALFDKALAEGIEVVAVTDHNHVGSVERMAAAAEERGITLFPGFEVSSQEGIHFLCLFEPGTSSEVLNRYLGGLGIDDTDPNTALSRYACKDLPGQITSRGGIAIAAHATSAKGLLRTLTGDPCIQAWKTKELLAIQIPGGVDDLPQRDKQIVTNRNAEYKRDPAPAKDLAVAVVNARDVAEPDDLADASATCWIKMTKPSIAGLTQAFLDPASRIRLNSDSVPDHHAEIVTIAWEGGFFDEAGVHFSENLNVLIGGRGTGKSTVVESIRHALDLEPLGEDAQRSHEGTVRYVLKSGTKVSLLVRSHTPDTREYLIERTVPNPPLVRDQHGTVLPLTPRDVIPGAEVYGQHEISELAKSPEKLTHLLRRFLETEPPGTGAKIAIGRDLHANRLELHSIDEEVERTQERLASLPALEETLKRYQQAGLENRLREQSLLVREDRLVTTARQRLEKLREAVTALGEVLPLDSEFVGSEALEELPNAAILRELKPLLESVSEATLAHLGKIEAAITAHEEQLAGVAIRWQDRKNAAEVEYGRILRELQKAKVDGEEFMRLRRQIEDLHPLREQLASLGERRRSVMEQRRTRLAQWEDAKADEFRRLERASRRVNRKLENLVRVNVIASGNREPLIALLREAASGGRLSEALERLREVEVLSLTELADALRAGSNELATRYRLPAGQAERLAQIPHTAIMQVEELDLPPITQVELNIAGEGQPSVWKPLDHLSTGQRATAILFLLLLDSTGPLVIDQPEDDLDNRFISEGIVPKMRENKRQRQFILATHNANIPVLGDAELIVGLKATGTPGSGREQIPESTMGSIDSDEVRELVEEVLEGGKEAFEARRRKYGF